MVKAAGVLKDCAPVSIKKFMVCPGMMLDGDVKVSTPMVTYSLPVLHWTVTVYRWLAITALA